jgi:hypothetical protein
VDQETLDKHATVALAIVGAEPEVDESTHFWQMLKDRLIAADQVLFNLQVGRVRLANLPTQQVADQKKVNSVS